MSDILKVLLLIYSCILIVNSISTFVLWRQTKDRLFYKALLIWLSCLVNFALQGVFQSFDLNMLIAYSTYLVTSFIILNFVTNTSYVHTNRVKAESKKNLLVSSLFILTGFGIQMIFQNFFIASILVSIGISVPMFYSCYIIYKLKADRTIGLSSLGILIFLNALHFLDYAFLRPSAVGAQIGFTFALLILFSLSIFIPAYIVSQLSKDYSLKLEKEVENKTRELEYLVQDKRALLSLVCHDIANPLQILKITATKLNNSLELKDFESCQKYISKVFQSVSTTVTLLQKVRDLQSARDGKSVLKLEPVNINEAVGEVISLYEDFLIQKNIIIEVKCLNPKTIAITDSIIFKNQVIGNLISNAIKFSKNNSKVQIQFVEVDDHIVIKIQDHGIGIPKDIMNNLFSFENRTSRLGTNNEKGTGLGLPVLKRYLELMDGKITVTSSPVSDSEKDHGSLFEIELPRAS